MPIEGRSASCGDAEKISVAGHAVNGKSGKMDGRWLADVDERQRKHDLHKAESLRVALLYARSNIEALMKRGRKMDGCADLLEFVREYDAGRKVWGLKFRGAASCSNRFCPWCSWRRSVKLAARFKAAMPKIESAYPTARWLFLTLTVRNCDVSDLGRTIQHMMKSWQRLHQRKVVKGAVLGWIRNLEVTRGVSDTAHPHFHCLLLVPSNYFTKNYITQSRWLELWQEATRDENITQVDIRPVKPKVEDLELAKNTKDTKKMGTERAISETFKYSVKAEDLTKGDPAWLWTLTEQMHNVRSLAFGGVLKEYVVEDEKPKADADESEATPLFAGFERSASRYRMRKRSAEERAGQAERKADAQFANCARKAEREFSKPS